MIKKYYRRILLCLFLMGGGSFYGSLGLLSYHSDNIAFKLPDEMRTHRFHYGAHIFYLNLAQAIPIWLLQILAALALLLIFSLMFYMGDTKTNRLKARQKK
jgi:hypothetical protein